MGFIVSVELQDLPTACFSPTLQRTNRHLQTLLIPNVNPHASVRSSIKTFIRENLGIADDLQNISAPLFTRLCEQDSVEAIHGRYCCHAEAENPDLHVDEETFTFFGRERGQVLELCDEDRLDQCHIIDELKLSLKRLPQKLPSPGGRIFVEMKNGILPLLGICPRTPVSQIKKTLEAMTGIPVSQQLLLSVGKVMHDEFFLEDYDGIHAIYEDSVLDLCKSGDTNAEQSHRRMVVRVCIGDGENEFTIVVQGRDAVHSVMEVVEARTGYAKWQQRVLFSGKALDENKTMSEYFIFPDCTLHVTIFRNSKIAMRKLECGLQNQAELSMDTDRKARKLKLVRTLRGIVMGTVTIPVLTTDTIFDLKRKIKRSLQPLVERNLSMPSPMKEHKHIDITPMGSPAGTNLKPSRLGIVYSPSSSSETIKTSLKKLPSSGSFATRSLSSTPNKATWSCLSTGSSPIGHQASAMTGHPKHTSRTPSSLPEFVVPNSETKVAVLLNAGHGSKTASARRLQFDSVEYLLHGAHGKSDEAAGTHSETAVSGTKQDVGMSAEKRGIGAWIHSNVHALTEQICAQLKES